MNYKDVALLNGSLDSLGDSLLKNKMMNQQSQQRLAETGLQSQRLQVDQSRWDAEQEHWKNMEKQIGLQTTLKDLTDSGARLHQGVKSLADQVANAGMDPEDATQYFKDSVDTLPDPIKAKFLQEPSMKALYNGDMDWAKMAGTTEGKDIQPKEFTVGGRHGIYNPQTGASIPDQVPRPGAFSDIDREEIRSLNNGLAGIDKETRVLASKPDPDRARALNAQRQIIQAKKDKLMLKYSQPAAAAPGGAAAPAGGAGGMIQMLDKGGNLVNVPAARKQEMLSKGYQEQ